MEDKVLAHTARAEAEIACGRAYAVIGELEALTGEHPYRGTVTLVSVGDLGEVPVGLPPQRRRTRATATLFFKLSTTACGLYCSGLPLSFREVEELMLVRGVAVSYETILRWCAKFGQVYANQLRRRRPRPGDKWHLDEVFVGTPSGRLRYLWRAVDQHGNVLDVLVERGGGQAILP